MEYKKYLDEGIELLYSAKYKEAIDLISQSIKIKNDFAVSYFYRAACFQCLKNDNEAILDYTKAIKLDSKMTDAYYNRAKIILENKESSKDRIKDAIKDLEIAISQDEKFIDALYALACAHKKLENYHLTLEYLEKLLQIEPDALQARALKKLILQKYIV